MSAVCIWTGFSWTLFRRWIGNGDVRNLYELDNYRLKNEELRMYGRPGGSGNGLFKVFIDGRSFNVIASNGGGWEHVSVSPRSKTRKSCPTWEEMCHIKDMFFEPEERVVQFHPPKSEYVNCHPYCLHLWRRFSKSTNDFCLGG